ncbi:SusC/RagA family TonB-linked outer membrane protein [Aquimarina sp. AD1]|uniref:SusC/RagA family TonB-linked outer membrane protein n=1 Tax=Aquimarina TaxID=290174 RepID=UPI0003F8A4E0|nr:MULTISPECIES: SusC/RagA family TonB-linked outer membrane protein [Aquimarina]AXT56846.1 SusC/RagA family TonB-linked outer membrane protein [Aquimarina sp. AD1]RKN11653.1 SusC/RagA family TonB-linked outer membrane protein [Aquimarina sp. AD1]
MKSMILKKLMFLLVFISGNMMFAQITVTGVTSDANGPIPGVNVLVRGTTNGAISDFDGNFTLNNVAEDATLIFSYVGFQTKAVSVNGKTVINVTLAEDAAELEAVVVIGYGTQSIKDATGAVAVISSKDFNQGAIASPEQLIQGKTAGVQITQASGEPGAGVSLRIRGTTSVRSNNNPLFVVDGVPLAGDDTAAGGSDLGIGTSSARNPLNFLNPNDIESVSILKDASATAIYGSRGANGVVIITTKAGRGAKGGLWEFSSTLSVAKTRKKLDLLNRDQFLNASADFGNNPSDLDFGADTDWQDEILRQAESTINSLSYSNNYKNGNVRASFGYGNQVGIVKKSSLERITGRINATHRFFNEKLKLNLQGTLSRVNDEAPPISNNAGFQGDLLGAAYSANPTWPATPNFDIGGTTINPLNLLTNTQNETNTNRYLVNFSAEYEIIQGLKAKINLGYDNSESTAIGVISRDVRNITNGGTSGNGRATVDDIEVENRLMEATLTYNTEIGNSTLELLGGYSYQDFGRKGRNVQGFGFSSTDLDQIGEQLEAAANAIEGNIEGSFQQYAVAPNDAFINRLFPDIVTEDITNIPNIAPTTVIGDTFDFTDELQSYFIRGTYTIADKYILTATARADGSSRFGPDNKFRGIFPSGAFAWKLDKEDFIGDAFSTLKLRLGFGVTGNQDGLGFGNFTFRQRFGGLGIQQNGDVNRTGAGFVSFANTKLKWETTTQTNVGIDFGFFGDRLTGTVDLYYKDTEDLLLQAETAQPSPTPFTFTNVNGNVINQGIEFSINYAIIEQEDVSWDFGFNIAYNKNELQNFTGTIPTGALNGQGLTGVNVQRLETGRPLASYYLRLFEGFDENGQGVYTNGVDFRDFVDKSALPEYNVGISTSFRYKNFDASVFFAGQFGHYIYNATRNAFFTAGSIGAGRNVTTDVIGNGEDRSNAPEPSTQFLEKGDFLRLQNASLGYNWPLSGEGLFKSLRLFVTGQNLFVITDYSGLDPEVNVAAGANGIPSLGIDYTSFPRPRVYNFGFNVTF